MKDLNKLLKIDVPPVTINLLIRNRADILINQELMVKILVKLNNGNKEEIYKKIEIERKRLYDEILDSIPKLI